LRRRRASAGESTTTVDGASPTSKTGKSVVTSPSSPLSPTPGIAMLASVMAAASSQRMSDRCRLPQTSSSSRQSAADTQLDAKSSPVSAGNSTRPSSANALSRTALNDSGRNFGSIGGPQTLRAHSGAGASSSTALGTVKKVQGTDEQPVSSSKTTSTGDSPRRSSSTAVPPPVPPKHTQSFKAEKRSPDTAVPSNVVTCSSSSSRSAAVTSVKVLSAGSSVAAGDTGTLPFANENVGTIRQRSTLTSVEQPATSVNGNVTTTTGNSFTFTSYICRWLVI